jgi:hypothetical protein
MCILSLVGKSATLDYGTKILCSIVVAALLFWHTFNYLKNIGEDWYLAFLIIIPGANLILVIYLLFKKKKN